MTKLLEQALAAVYQLPEQDQDAIASLILDKIASKDIEIVPSPISKAHIETLERFYTLRERPEILPFLEKFPFLVPPLLEAPDKIRQHFPDAKLFLQVVDDPEIIDYVHLVLSILTKIDPDDAVSKLNQVDKEWELGLSYEVRKRFFTALE
ncbi:MAG TPA: hypothetical protein V6D14_14415 [Coleofasciculaceae cyanobacterium]|jgi:hypothetical protein